jgi:hypothetical protein
VVLPLAKAIEMLPDVKPPIVRYVWGAKLHHDSKGRYPYEPLTLEDYEGLLKGRVKPWSKSAISKARREYPHLLPWDRLKVRDARPPWEDHPELLEQPGLADEPMELQPILRLGDIELVVPVNGGLVRAVVHKAQKLTTLVASFVGATTLLDVASDGKLNHIIAWCHLLAPLHLRF